MTRNHPFFVEGKGFVPAGGFAVGNAIVTRAGPSLTVKSIQWERSAQGFTVYNLLVQDDHTYFVGNGEAWVHNGRKKCLPGYASQPADPEAAEAKLRELLGRDNLRDADHRINGPRPDAEWNGRGEDPGWSFAEVKPDNRLSRRDLFAQMRQRYDEGYTGVGRAYAYSRDENGNLILRFAREYQNRRRFTVPPK